MPYVFNQTDLYQIWAKLTSSPLIASYIFNQTDLEQIYNALSSGGFITGTLTTNRIPKAASASSVNDSNYEQVSGNLRPITDNTYSLGDSSHYLTTTFTNNLQYSSTLVLLKSGVESVRIDNTGKLGVNTGALTIGQISTRGSGNTSATYSFSAVNSDGIVSVLIRDDTKMSVGTSTFTDPLGGEADFVVGGVNGELSKLFKYGNRATFYHDGNTGIWSVSNSGGPVNFGTYNSTALVFLMANTEKMRLDTSGNFGINTSPTSGFKLDVKSDGNTSASAMFLFRSSDFSSYFNMVSSGTATLFSNASADYAINISGKYTSGVLYVYPTVNSQVLHYSTNNSKTGTIYQYYYNNTNNEVLLRGQYQHAGSGTASNQYFQEKFIHNTSTTSNVLMAETRVVITDNTHASRKSKYSIYTADSAAPDEYFKVHGKYVMLSTPNSAPVDADLNAASVEFYLDEAGNNLKVRVKYTDGVTLKTGTIALV